MQELCHSIKQQIRIKKMNKEKMFRSKEEKNDHDKEREGKDAYK